ncbi:monosaccharide ABC transporter membrane protein (CUT2 family) [Hydrogenispora ethanolica]|uniref:Monosaccharide ABC transporter membrane protein (CUT2 family) n=1 Tax=Hydrogenispora ethanolica TaxID=1082276 RepID=A0A4R1R1N9_HYDET|nr:monosaccharide ABC transporter membrane protein (CUT2 family) [Hydrogenispora ethanolica]
MEKQIAAKPMNLALDKERIRYLFANYGIIFVFALLCVVLSFASPYFLKEKNIVNVLRQTSINGLLSIGMTFVILTGGIDLSVGSILAFSAMVAASFSSATFSALGGHVYSPALAYSISLGAGLVLGLINGVFIAKWKVAPFVVTLGMLSMARGLTYIYNDGMPIPNIDPSFLPIGQGMFYAIPVPVLIFAVVFIIAWLILYRTRFGRYVYAVGGNEKSAKLSGVNTRLIFLCVYGICGLLAALGGLILTARTTAGLPQAGVNYELDAIAAVVIGGTSLNGGQGTLTGTLFGALIMGVINNGLDLLGVSSYFQQLIKGAIIVLAVLLDSFQKGGNKD